MIDQSNEHPNEDEVRGLSWLMRVASEYAFKWGWTRDHFMRLAAYWWASATETEYVDPVTGEVKDIGRL